MDYSTSEYLSPKSFDLLKYLDEGSFGKVLLVRKNHGKNQNKIFAMKIVHKSKIIGNTKSLKYAMSESNVLRTLNHVFITGLMYSFHSNVKLYYVMEYVSGGNLAQLMRKKGAFTEGLAAFYVEELILAIEYVHNCDIIHRDLKPENILIDSNGHIKLTDFGLCKQNISSACRTSSLCGTLFYMAPEVLQEKDYGKEVDWWSLGVIFYEMVMNERPFTDTINQIEFLENLIIGEYEPPDHISDEAQNVICGLLQFESNTRLGYNGVEQVKAHYYFAETCWKTVLECSESPPQFNKKAAARKYNLPNPRLDSESSMIKADNDLFKGFSFVNPKLAKL